MRVLLGRIYRTVMWGASPFAGRAVTHDGPLFVPWLPLDSECLAALRPSSGFFHFDTDGRYRSRGLLPIVVSWRARSVSARAVETKPGERTGMA